MSKQKKGGDESANRKLTALVVDDLPVAREEMRYHVGALGHSAVEVGCIEEARERLTDTEIDYVLLDLQIPWAPNTLAQISFGEAFLHELVRDHPDLPVVVVTGQGKTFAYHGRVVHAGPCVSFVTKPFDDEDPTCPHLTEEINRVFQKKRAWLEQRSQALVQSSERPAAPVQLATIDVARVGKYRHLQIYCTVDGQVCKVSKRQYKILGLFEDAQRRHGDPSSRYKVEVDVTPTFEVPEDPERTKEVDQLNVRYSAISKLKKRIEEGLPAGHPPIFQPGSSKGWYRLGCHCISSVTDPEST